MIEIDFRVDDDRTCIFHGSSINAQGAIYVSLADYCAMSETEVSLKERETVEFLKEGCGGWWFVKLLGN